MMTEIGINAASVLVAFGLALWQIKRDRRKDTEARIKADIDKEKAMNKLTNTFQDELSGLQASLQTSLPKIESKFDRVVSDLRLEMEKKINNVVKEQDTKRNKDVQVLNSRINAVETKYATEVMERIGKMEGTITSEFGSIKTTLNLLQRHFIENGGNE